MARTRKEKGGKRRVGSEADVTKTASSKKSQKSEKDVLKDQITSLGGTAEDFDLIKNADKASAFNGSSNSAVDAALTKDVSQFLKELNFDVPELPQNKNLTNQKETPKSTKKSKKALEQTPKTSKEKDGKKGTVIEKDKKKGKATEGKSAGEGDGKDSRKEKSGHKGKKESTKDMKHTDAEKSSKKPKKNSNESENPQATSTHSAQSNTAIPKKINFDSKSSFVFHPTAQWYAALPALKPASSTLTPTPAQLNSLTRRAADLHSADIETFKSSSSSSGSEAGFLSKIIQSGTLSDRLSALTLLVQSSPVHNTKALETLKGMAERGKGKGGREESLKALRCIVDWWVGGGAPDRKLRYFRDQPLLHPDVTDEHLLVCYFEDWLKKYFFSVLQILESHSLDPLPYVRTQTLTLLFTLLRDKPEQEQNLLRLLVNKLGDTEKSLCSRASYHLLQLLQVHPVMKSVVVREIIGLVLKPAVPTAAATVAAAAAFTASTSTSADVAKRRIKFADSDDESAPNASSSASEKGKKKSSPDEKKPGNPHARYYSTITFNQITLTPGDREVAIKLIEVYFEMFKELLGEGKISDIAEAQEDGDDESAKGKGKEVQMDKKGRVIDYKKKGKGKAAEVKGAAGFAEVEDENSKLISAILTGVNRALPFAKIDVGDVGLLKHIDTLFLITHKSTFNISLQALVLIQQISASLSSVTPSGDSSATSKSIVDRYYRTLYSSLHDSRLSTSSKQAMYLNLLFKSIKADAGNADAERMKALVRRFVQVLVSGGNGATEFVAGGLYLLGELFSSVPGLRSMVTEPAKEDAEPYDPVKREPLYARASSTPLWELTPLLYHYHPTVSLHARQLLSSQPLTASADLSLNTLSHFLDRFVYKNPKKQSVDATATKGRGASAMQPAGSALEGVKLTKGEANVGETVNDERFWKKKAGDVPVDELFFHKFFTRKQEREKAAAKRKGKDGDENEDEELDGDEDEDEVEVEEGSSGDESSEEEMDLTGDEAERNAKGGSQREEEDGEDEDEDENDSDLEEEEIWKAMKASMPKEDGDDDLMESSEDEDDLPSDFDVDSEDDVDIDEDVEDDEAEVDDDDEDGLSLVEGSDNEDLISLNGDLPEGFIAYDGSDAEDEDGDEEEEWGGISAAVDRSKKRKRADDDKKRRKKLKSLPTFASYEDYAKMIEEGPEDDI